MREDELRALVRNDPAGFRRYVGFLETERGRKWRIADMAGQVSYFTTWMLATMVGLALAFLVTGHTRHDAGGWTHELYAALIVVVALACMNGVAKGVIYVVDERIRRIDREIALADSIASATLAAGTTT